MAEEITVVGIGGDGCVRAVRVLVPSRIITLLRCRWILELPMGHPTPTVGERVSLVRVRSANPA